VPNSKGFCKPAFDMHRKYNLPKGKASRAFSLVTHDLFGAASKKKRTSKVNNAGHFDCYTPLARAASLYLAATVRT